VPNLDLWFTITIFFSGLGMEAMFFAVMMYQV